MTYADTIAVAAVASVRARKKTIESRPSWREIAHAGQLPPQDWRTWYVRGGRGSGKTWCGANTLAEMSQEEPGEYGVVAPTFEAVRTVCFEGPRSGLIHAFGTNISEIKRGASNLVDSYNLSTAILRLRNGSIIYGDGADDGAPTIQGKNLRGLWADEVGLWRKWQQAWSESIRYAVRLAPARIIATGTPKAGHPLVKALMTDDTVYKTLLRTSDNIANLDADFIAELYARYGGTQLGRQELEGEMIDDVVGALWHRPYFIYGTAPALLRIVVGIDPAVTSEETSDLTGIVAAGKAADRRGYVLADRSGRYTPDGWARAAVNLAAELSADAIIVETNNGGDMCKLVLENELERRRNVGAPVSVAVKGITASRGKRTRAEPIAQLYEQGRVTHAEPFPALEDELCTWAPEEDDKSPDRLDAMVWALTDLMLGEPGILGMYRKLMEQADASVVPGAIPVTPLVVPREQCQTALRVDNRALRCRLSLGHAGEHVAQEEAFSEPSAEPQHNPWATVIAQGHVSVMTPLSQDRTSVRERCPTAIRVDNSAYRCCLAFGHRGEHVPGDEAVA